MLATRPQAWCRAAAIAAAAVVLALLPALPAKAAVRPLATGISNIYSNETAAFAHTRAAGGTVALTPLRWNAIAPPVEPANWDPANPADHNYEWKFFDIWINRAVAAGLTPVVQIRGAPHWAERCVPSADSEAVCNPDPADFAAFTRAAALRYSGHFGGLPRVRYWEGMNEPNLSLYFQPQFENGKPVSPELYRILLNLFYGVVKGVDPTNQVLAPGLGPIAVPRYTIGPMQFTRQLLCMTGGKNPKPTPGDCGGGVYFDIFDMHPYTTGRPDHEGGPNDVQMGDLPKLQRLIRAADRAGRIRNDNPKATPLWITEFAYDSNPPDPGGLPMKIERQWIAEALHQAWLNKVPTFLWYSLDDSEPNPRVPFSATLESGLYFWAPDVAAAQPKPAMYAFRFPFVAFHDKNRVRFWGRTPTSTSGRVVLQAKRGGKWRRIGSTRADAAGIFKGALKTSYGANKKGAIRAWHKREGSPGFPMRRAPDFSQPPFG